MRFGNGRLGRHMIGIHLFNAQNCHEVVHVRFQLRMGSGALLSMDLMQISHEILMMIARLCVVLRDEITYHC